ncbi:homeobox protein Hox-B5a-like protein [Dinothrombium tinctorium]|uniref:Homeobox protein Hox-B5a-like protein n=1 Tax=Dinothrombium tinctorium TaxID=1965070 RepID=A0A3S3Q019_9ACAR|nr:homeobox protein Hox-B5a-like protein [Dinothrombium tinctorium]RWS12671.1 homeobox protein Hox-B5a-like protein [Dinothrombium tinctorium]
MRTTSLFQPLYSSSGHKRHRSSVEVDSEEEKKPYKSSKSRVSLSKDERGKEVTEKQQQRQQQQNYHFKQHQLCSSYQEGGKTKRVRTIFTPEQLERLENEFERQQYMQGSVAEKGRRR